jgi:hypothetical protein
MLFCFETLAYAEPAAKPSVVPSVAPGVYNSPQIITFSYPTSARLLVSIDGAPLSETAEPVMLTVPSGATRTYSVETVLYPYDPNGSTLIRSRFSWTIDRERPATPDYFISRIEGGQNVELRSASDETICWKMFYPWYGASSSGDMRSSGVVFVPDGATLCAYVIDVAGNRGRAISLEATAPVITDFPCKLISPVSGTWANPQALVIEAGNSIEVSYTTDGSDPATNGIPYREPVILSDTKISSVRVYAIDAVGTVYTDRVEFTVVPSTSLADGTSPVHDLRVDVPLVENGDFREIHTTTGFTCSAGNTVLSETALEQLVLTSIRGVRSYQPLTVTDGKSLWRWVFALGAKRSVGDGIVAGDASDSSGVPVVTEKPEVSIHDWYFVDVTWKDPVYISLDSNSWAPCIAPVFVDRSRDHSLLWYSSSWKGGEIQKLPLPAKPALSGIPEQALTANPVFIGCDDTPFTLYYEGGYYEPRLPSASSATLSSGLLVEIANGAESTCTLQFRAVLDGIDHGKLSAFFVIDRKAPRTPSAGIPDSLVYSRDPVVITPTGEDMIQVSINPDLFSQEGRSFTLLGDPKKAVEYTVKMFAVDRAGNRSPLLVRNITVDRNTLYVDSNSTVNGNRNGRPDSPYRTLDDALSAIGGSQSWRIELAGDTTLSSFRVIKNDIAIHSDGRAITFAPGATLSVIRSAVSFTNCRLDFSAAERVQSVGSPMKLSSKPPVLLDSASMSFSGCVLTASLSSAGTFLQAKDSRVTLSFSSIAFEAPEYALLMDASRCDVMIRSCKLSVSSRDASALSLSASNVTLSDSRVTVMAESAGRAIEAWGSMLSIARMTLERTTENGTLVDTNRDTAVWLDASSHIASESDIIVSGFANARGTESRK